MSSPDRLRIAVFIDFDNVEIGVKNTLNASFDAGLILDALKERGEVVSKMAYGDWQRSGGYSRMLTQHAIRMVQRNPTPGGDKNGADINLALDALEMAFTHTHINAFVIVGGDSDFISLVEKLKQYDKQIFIVGGRQFTSQILQRNCHEFIAYENLMGAGGGASASAAGGGMRRHGGREARTERASIEQAIPLVQRALKVLIERDVSPQLGLLKSTLLQLDSTFSERTYGAGSFRDFAEKLQKAGAIALYQSRGSWMVGPPSGGQAVPDAGVATDEPAPVPSEPSGQHGHHRTGGGLQAPIDGPRSPGGPTAVIGTPADGVRELARALGSVQIRRWPLYLRNVKQFLRQASPGFDERSYGFASLVDLLRAAHKEGVVRVERDRQGVIRVFEGATPAGAPASVAAAHPPPVVDRAHVDADVELDDDAAVAMAAADLGVPVVAGGELEAETSADDSSTAPAAPRSRRGRRPRSSGSPPRSGRRKKSGSVATESQDR